MLIIPTWDDAHKACINGGGNALEKFIDDNEPAGPDAEEFRTGLQSVVDWVVGNGHLNGAGASGNIAAAAEFRQEEAALDQQLGING